MIRALVATALMAASSISIAATSNSSASDLLISSVPWWEKVTVTLSGDGQPRSCQFQSSLQPTNMQNCDVAGHAAAGGKSGGATDQFTRITFERQFSPGAAPKTGALAMGDTLLGRQVMALAIDARGAVKGCRVVAAGGAMTPDYGCDEAAAERFEASTGRASEPAREAYMTILVYGHSEHFV